MTLTHAVAAALALVAMAAISQQPPEATAEDTEEMQPTDERPEVDEEKHATRELLVVATDTAIEGDFAIAGGLVVEEGARLRLGSGYVTLAGNVEIRASSRLPMPRCTSRPHLATNGAGTWPAVASKPAT